MSSQQFFGHVGTGFTWVEPVLSSRLSYTGSQIKYRSKQCGPRTDCSYRSSLICVHTVCHRGFLNISADEKSRGLLLRLALYGLKHIRDAQKNHLNETFLFSTHNNKYFS